MYKFNLSGIMDTAVLVRKSAKEKALEIIGEVNSFVDTLPGNEIYALRTRLRNCMSSVPEDIDTAFRQKSRLNKIRAFVRASGYLHECKDYLHLLKKLEYDYPDELEHKIDELANYITANSSSINVN
jgi:four helix bundle protein